MLKTAVTTLAFAWLLACSPAESGSTTDAATSSIQETPDAGTDAAVEVEAIDEEPICLHDEECAWRPYCDPRTWHCSWCTDEYCSDRGLVCTQTGHCGECNTAADCPLDRPFCEDDFTCSQCHADDDCPDSSPVCDSGACKTCDEGDELNCTPRQLARFAHGVVCEQFANVRTVDTTSIGQVQQACSAHPVLSSVIFGWLQGIASGGVRVTVADLKTCAAIADAGGQVSDCLAAIRQTSPECQLTRPCECGAEEVCIAGSCHSVDEDMECDFKGLSLVDGVECRSLRGPNARCADETSCAPGLQCQHNRCVSLSDVDESCTEPNGCLRGVCMDGQCSELPIGAGCDPANAPGDILDPCGKESSCNWRTGSCLLEGDVGASCVGPGSVPCRSPDLICGLDGVCSPRICRE